jgi:hypothetical protein
MGTTSGCLAALSRNFEPKIAKPNAVLIAPTEMMIAAAIVLITSRLSIFPPGFLVVFSSILVPPAGLRNGMTAVANSLRDLQKSRFKLFASRN